MVPIKKIKWVWFSGQNWSQNGPISQSEMLLGGTKRRITQPNLMIFQKKKFLKDD